MKTKSLFVLVLLAIGASFLTVGCSSSSEPEIDKNVPMGKDTDPFKPTSVTGAAGGGNAPKGSEMGTPSSQ